MTELFENWRDYQETQEANQFVQDIWEGKFLESSPIIYEANGVWHLDSRLDEGLWDFMKSVVSWGKSKYAEFEDWAESKLQKVVDAALEKLQSFLSKGREITKNAEGKMKSFLMKLFNKNQYRRIRDVLGALRQPQWLAVGATLLSMLLQKVAKMGMNRLLDAASGGSATAAKVINFIRENYEKFQEFMEMIMDFLDPNGLLDTIENLGIFKDAIEKFQQLKKDIRSQAFKENIMESLLDTLTDEQLTEIVRASLIESGKCQKGYKTHPTRKTKELYGKQYRNCIPADEALRTRVRETIMRRLQEEGGCYSDKEICTPGLKFVVNSDSPGIKDVKCEDGVLKNWSARAAQIASKYCKDDNYGRGKKDESLEEGDLQKWADEKWTHSDGTPCGDGRDDGSVERCKPKAKWAKMDKGEKAADNAKKRAGTKKGKQNVAATKKGKVTKSYTKR